LVDYLVYYLVDYLDHYLDHYLVENWAVTRDVHLVEYLVERMAGKKAES
jgi:hypothetical protein